MLPPSDSERFPQGDNPEHQWYKITALSGDDVALISVPPTDVQSSEKVSDLICKQLNIWRLTLLEDGSIFNYERPF